MDTTSLGLVRPTQLDAKFTSYGHEHIITSERDDGDVAGSGG